MLGSDVKQELMGIIKRELIPEYKKVFELKESIRKKTMKYIEDTYMTSRDKEIIKSYPLRVMWTDSMCLAGNRYDLAGVNIVCGYNSYSYYTYSDYNDLYKIDFGKQLPDMKMNIENMAKTDPEFKKIIWSDLKSFAENLKKCLDKLEKAEEFLNHPKVNITFIKKNYEVLYKLYKDGADKGSEV